MVEPGLEMFNRLRQILYRLKEYRDLPEIADSENNFCPYL